MLTEIFYPGQSAEVFICIGIKQIKASVITCDLILNSSQSTPSINMLYARRKAGKSTPQCSSMKNIDKPNEQHNS